jgi:glycosyltransferase involved in cell wall biosynthesis
MVKKKILYLCQTLGIGGAEQLLLTTLKYLDKERFQPVVYCIGEKGAIGEEIEKTGTAVCAMNRRIYLWNIGIARALVKIFRKEKPDILHTNLFYPNYFGRVAAMFARVPIVIATEHGTYSGCKKSYHYLIDFILSFYTTKIIAVSEAVKRYLMIHALIPAKKITVVYNAIDFDRFEKTRKDGKDSAKKKLGFSDTDFLIGCVGNISPWKGYLYLLEAFKAVLGDIPQAKLCIVGRDNLGFRGQLEEFTGDNGLRKSVNFLGERRDIPEILNVLDLFVFPPVTEGLGISLLEAMYMGLPVIASRVEGVSEVVEDEKDGILLPPAQSRLLAEKITGLYRDKNTMLKIAGNARAKIESRFLPKDYIRSLESLYLKGSEAS